MPDNNELVTDFINATQLSLDAGFPRTAKGILETHWLEGTADDEQRQRLDSLRMRIGEDLRIEDQYGRGALINLEHGFTKKLLKRGRIAADHLAAMQRFRSQAHLLVTPQGSQ